MGDIKHSVPKWITGTICLVMISLLGAAPAWAQTEKHTVFTEYDFHWLGQLKAGQTLEVINRNGQIEASAVAGDEARVEGIRRGNDDDQRKRTGPQPGKRGGGGDDERQRGSFHKPVGLSHNNQRWNPPVYGQREVERRVAGEKYKRQRGCDPPGVGGIQTRCGHHEWRDSHGFSDYRTGELQFEGTFRDRGRRRKGIKSRNNQRHD